MVLESQGAGSQRALLKIMVIQAPQMIRIGSAKLGTRRSIALRGLRANVFTYLAKIKLVMASLPSRRWYGST